MFQYVNCCWTLASWEGLGGLWEFGYLIWFSFNSWQFVNKIQVAHFPCCSLGERKKICLQDSVIGNLNLLGLWTRQVKEKESPGWPTHIAHLGCLQKSLLILLDCTSTTLNCTGYEIKSCLCPLVTLEGTEEIFRETPHLTLGETEGPRSKITTNVTQPIWWQTKVPDSLTFH